MNNKKLNYEVTGNDVLNSCDVNDPHSLLGVLACVFLDKWIAGEASAAEEDIIRRFLTAERALDDRAKAKGLKAVAKAKAKAKRVKP